MYKLEFLSLAIQDMTDIVKYISDELSNPTSAEKLADEFIKVAESLVEFPYRNRVYGTIKPLKKEYRRQIINNYIMFYYIDEEERVITIARVIYARKNYRKILN